MRYLIIASAFLVACDLIEPTECHSDQDCKADRICEDGSCVDPDSGSSSAGLDSTSVGGSSDCESVIVDCDCYGSYYPGTNYYEPGCSTGVAQIRSCGQYCYDGNLMIGSVCLC